MRLESVRVDLRSGRGDRDGVAFQLTEKELALLRYLADRPRQLIRRDELLVEVWGYHESSTSRAVDKTLNRLRAKVEPTSNGQKFLRTVYGEGVAFHPPIAPVEHNLPRAMDRFVGHEADLVALDAWLASESRLLTVTGVGGVGKSRLVREACRRWLADEEVRSIWCCEFGDAQHPSDFLSTLARALDAPTSDAPTPESLAEALQARGEWILVLDDVDTVIDGVVAALAHWLHEVPTVRILATSRERLACRGEQVHELEALPETEAALLLRDRTGWGPEGHEQEVTALVERTEGIPLAIELIGATAASLPVKVLLEQLEQGTHAPSSRVHEGRHRTMASALQWSWDRLNADEQRALAEATVFHQFIPSGAAAVVLSSPAPYQQLANLRARSLLCDREGRLGMYEAVRRFAARGLAPSDMAAVKRRHASFCAERLEHLADREGRLRGYDLLLEEVGEDNVWAAHRWAAQFAPDIALRLVYGILQLLSQRVPPPRLIALSTQALEAAPDTDPRLVHEVTYARAVMKLIARQPGGREELEDVLAWAMAQGDRRLEARVLRGLSVYPQEGRDQIGDSERAVTLAESVSPIEAAYAWVALGWALIQQQQYDRAREAFDEASDQFRALGQAGPVAWSDSSVLWMEDRREDLAHRLDRLLGSGGVEALAPGTQSGVVTIVTHALMDLGRYREGIEWAEHGLRLHRLHASNVRALATFSHNLGICSAGMGDYPTAIEHLDRAVRACRDADPRRALFACIRASLDALRGDHIRARDRMVDLLPNIPSGGLENQQVRLWWAALHHVLEGPEAAAALVPEPFEGRGREVGGFVTLRRALLGEPNAWRTLANPARETLFARSREVSAHVRLLVRYLEAYATPPKATA